MSIGCGIASWSSRYNDKVQFWRLAGFFCYVAVLVRRECVLDVELAWLVMESLGGGDFDQTEPPQRKTICCCVNLMTCRPREAFPD